MLFNGTNVPQVLVQVAGAVALADPNAGAFVVGVNVVGDTVGSVQWTTIPGELVDAVTINAGGGGPTDSASPTTCSVVVDNFSGAYDPDNASSPYRWEVGQPVRVRAVWGGTVYQLWSGFIDDLLPDDGWEPTLTLSCSDGLAQLGRAKIAAIVPAFDGDRTDVRLARILSEAQWPASLRALDAGVVSCRADDYGDWALALAQQVRDTELGELFIDHPTGRLTFFNRLHTYVASRSTTVQATFSDAGSDIDFTGLTRARRRGEVYNSASITPDGGTEQTFTDAASVAAYGPQSYPGSIGTLLRTDGDAQSLCRWVVARWKAATTRYASIDVDASAQGMWSTLLPLRRYDRIRAVRTYTPAVTLDKSLLIEGLGHSITTDSWGVSISTRNAEDFSVFRVGISLVGGPDVVA